MVGECLTVKQPSPTTCHQISRPAHDCAVRQGGSVIVVFELMAHGSDHDISGAVNLEQRDVA